jgi:hypothetical protein
MNLVVSETAIAEPDARSKVFFTLCGKGLYTQLFFRAGYHRYPWA